MIKINNIHHFDSEIASAGDKLGSFLFFSSLFLISLVMVSVIVDFAATWCMPCKVIAPHFERLSQEYSDSALFLKVDVDACEEVALNQGISALPTFIFYKNQEVIDRVQGSHPIELEGKIRSHVSVQGEVDESGSNHGTTSEFSSSPSLKQQQKSSRLEVVKEPTKKEDPTIETQSTPK